MTPTRCPLPRHHFMGDYFNARLFYARTAAGADIKGMFYLEGAEPWLRAGLQCWHIVMSGSRHI